MMLLGHMLHGGMRCFEVTMLSLLWGAVRPLLHDVKKCRRGAGGDCGPKRDVAAVVEHDITGVRGVEGSNVTVTCRMGRPHRGLMPTFPMM